MTTKIGTLRNMPAIPQIFPKIPRDIIIIIGLKFRDLPISLGSTKFPIKSCTNIKETIVNKKTGFLYKHDDPRELAKNLNTVIQLSPDELKNMGNEGRKNITKKYDVETKCQSNLKEYRRLIKNLWPKFNY